jgi:hypothetical protein
MAKKDQKNIACRMEGTFKNLPIIMKGKNEKMSHA